MSMKRHKPEEIVTMLRQVEVAIGQGMARIDAIREVLMCYPTRPRSGSEFPPFDHAHGLVSCADFIMSAGTLSPMALCGRCSL